MSYVGNPSLSHPPLFVLVLEDIAERFLSEESLNALFLDGQPHFVSNLRDLVEVSRAYTLSAAGLTGCADPAEQGSNRRQAWRH